MSGMKVKVYLEAWPVSVCEWCVVWILHNAHMVTVVSATRNGQIGSVGQLNQTGSHVDHKK